MSSLFLAILAVVLSGLIDALWAQPYGLTERVSNRSLLIDLEAEGPPPTISASGLFADIATQKPAAGIIPYGVNSKFWSDGIYKTRYLALPGEARIGFSRDGGWQFPANTVLVKNFYLEFVRGDPTSREIIETRLLVKVGTLQQWRGFSYMWNEDGSDAELLADSERLSFIIEDPDRDDGLAEYSYFFPGPQDCNLCHTEAAGSILGLRTAQLNGLYDYGGTLDHQLRALNHIGVFDEDIGEDYGDFPRWDNPLDDTAPIESRARSYLAANCGHCHRPGGIERASIDLRYETPLADTKAVGASPMLGRLDSEDALIINPGDPSNSTILLRMLSFGSNRMPPVATSVIDERGTVVIEDWIESLQPSTAVSGRHHQPVSFSLAQNYPNPFNPQTTIRYSLHAAGVAELAVYNALGQRVRTLVAGERAPGRHVVQWDGRGDSGRALAAGVYFYQLRAGGQQEIRKLVLLQ